MLKNRLAIAAALLSVFGFLGWLAKSDPDGDRSAPGPTESPQSAGTSRVGGSAVPCAVPLAWRILDVDPRFELPEGRAVAAVEDAASAWERAAGLDLFVHDPARGFPIRFVFDERQVAAVERSRLEASLAAVDERLRGERDALLERDEAYRAERDAYDRRVAVLERRAAAHADTVRVWNALGGAPAPRVAEIEVGAAEIDREREALMRVGRALQEEGDALRAAAERLNERVAEHRRAADGVVGSLPAGPVESGLYRELVGRDGERVVGIERAIDVYRFGGADDLWRVVAHELGHALGLGHAEGPGAVMSEEHRRAGPALDGIQPGDLALLAEVCPDLALSAPLRP